MGTVLREEGYRVVVRTTDHLPPHVHVFKAGHHVKISIGDYNTAPVVLRDWGAPEKLVNRAVRLVGEHQEMLLERWRQIYG